VKRKKVTGRSNETETEGTIVEKKMSKEIKNQRNKCERH